MFILLFSCGSTEYVLTVDMSVGEYYSVSEKLSDHVYAVIVAFLTPPSLL